MPTLKGMEKAIVAKLEAKTEDNFKTHYNVQLMNLYLIVCKKQQNV